MPPEKVELLYASIQHSITGKHDQHGPRLYYGLVYKIPRADIGTERQIIAEKAWAEEINAALKSEHPDVERVPGAYVERIEILEASDEGGLWVMYRIPYRPKVPVAG